MKRMVFRLLHINTLVHFGVFIYDRMLVIRQATQSGDVFFLGLQVAVALHGYFLIIN